MKTAASKTLPPRTIQFITENGSEAALPVQYDLPSCVSVGNQDSISRGVQTLCFESLGVRLGLTADTPEVFSRFPDVLPPDAQIVDPVPDDHTYGVHLAPDGSYGFTRDGSPVTSGTDLEFALSLLEHQIRIFIGINAPDRIFVHAGVVGHRGRAIVVPGRSFTGKTTLVLALVRAGATYYSDEFAVIDPEGLVHAYPRSPSIRGDGDNRPAFEAAQLGAEPPPPIPVGAVVLAEYRPGATWAPQQLSRGRGALGMFANTLAALQRSEEAMRVLGRALDGALVLDGERGEADDIAAQLLDLVSGSRAPQTADLG